MAGVNIHLDLRNPWTQTIGVAMRWTPQQSLQTLSLPVWTPGSYTVRDPSQHLHSLSVVQGDRVRNGVPQNAGSSVVSRVSRCAFATGLRPGSSRYGPITSTQILLHSASPQW